MKGFERKNQLLSLCGLHCGLCPMRLGKHCGGCGSGNQSCAIAKCSLDQGKIEYCYQCAHYPCEKYDDIEKFDSFITHRGQKSNLEKARRSGIDVYDREQEEKVRILNRLLSDYCDGRRKNFFCVAVNLLEISEIQEALDRIEAEPGSALSVREKSQYAADVFREIAARRNIALRLNRKK